MTDTRAGTEPGDGTSPGPSVRVARGRPRSAAADTAIIEAVLSLLEEGATIADLSMERIARAAGVGKATVYRRWAGKNALMLDVMKSVDEQTPRLAGRSVRDDLVTCVEFIRRRALVKRSSALLRNVIAQAQNEPELWAAYHDTVIAARRAQVGEVLRRGVRTGELRADIDPELLGDLFLGPMLSRSMLRPDAALPEGLSELIVDAVLQGVRAGN
ncbi:TetR/AcrR family transcriptional regulator [Actinacidiphila glaucinigra]|uniref:TetR/AcrR family transcriptional regulator n=1 Tax=Actinacidiphila glaucinigra TaxID=235986 RepID=UPI002DDBFDB6|nr:TetR/AcrR family transcriptional regulator [Actinacidiphila glaucinigra]WSD62471.1 TetR/AcrR family transcriptional regulator [Actinacidiphila glaucinigra]